MHVNDIPNKEPSASGVPQDDAIDVFPSRPDQGLADADHVEVVE